MACTGFVVLSPYDFFALVMTTVVPALPFLVMGSLSVIYAKSISFPGMLGALLGALLAICIPVTMFVVHYGGGANIGAGIVLTYLPFYMLIFVIVGWLIGRQIVRR